jgi:hypothetical protein
MEMGPALSPLDSGNAAQKQLGVDGLEFLSNVLQGLNGSGNPEQTAFYDQAVASDCRALGQ